ncbi:MAG: alpha/beta hydrolase domain-containing protein [Gemmatimonadaceae bacterium]
MRFRRSLAAALGLLLTLLAPADALARVVRVTIDRRDPISGGASFGKVGAYDRITGRVYFAFDPANPYDRGIVDLDRAPRNARGEVEAWSEFVMLVPHDPAKRSGVTLVDVVNRGGMTVGVFHLNAQRDRPPTDSAYYGDAFLLRRGHTIVMIGWQWDILPGTAGLHFNPPVAGDAASPITGLVRSDITIDAPTRSIPLGHRVGTSQALGYAVSDQDDSANTLTVRDDPLGARRVIPRGEWRFAREELSIGIPDSRNVYLASGFEAGKIYEVIYRAKDPVVVGTGLAAVRDLISYLKYDTTSIAPTKFGIAYGVSQTGRFLRHFLYEGFNTDENGRAAFDGIFAHTAGAGRGSFNHRFAQPSRDAQPYSTFSYPTDLFPFTSIATRDPVTGARGGLRSRVPQRAPLPKVFFVDGGYEYWGRAASLTHTSVNGRTDIGFLPSERRYVLSSAQHSGPAGFPLGDAQQITGVRAWRGDPLDQRLALRALFVGLTRWVQKGVTPPASVYPTLRASTLVRASTRRNPAIPGIVFPGAPYTPNRLSFGTEWSRGLITREPPDIGAPYTVLVPRANSFGNEVGGIQSVEIQVPLGSYLPWQLRTVPPTDRLVSFQGVFAPLHRLETDRRETGDSRPSIERLYPSRQRFLAAVDRATRTLVRQRFLLADDRAVARERMEQTWQWVHTH